ncbi:hypothetical protein ACK8OR_02440 [Jannaschia sp. KMU-145]|uniref:hypothetical protein n=1 Tax=Jannaschia halovivens TaxID=3388667 RepID=UPI00396B27BA
MRRWHFYVMGAIALVYGLLAMAEYVFVAYGMRTGWMALYSDAQIAWLGSIPGWVHGVWGAHVTLALVGALCLLAHLRPAVWMLAFSFLTLVVLYVWMLVVAEPSVIAMAGGGTSAWLALGGVLLLSFLIYLYARQEKQVGEVL